MANPEVKSWITERIEADGSRVTEIGNPAAFKPLVRILPMMVQTVSEIILNIGVQTVKISEKDLYKIKTEMTPEERIAALNILLKLSQSARTLSAKKKFQVWLS